MDRLSNDQHAFSQQSAGLWNRRLILRLLTTEGPHSRLRIARRTGIQNSTVTHIIRDLLDHGMLETAGKAEAVGAGRRHVLLEVNARYGWVAGISLQQDNVADVVFMDAARRILGEDRIRIDTTSGDLATDLQRSLAGILRRPKEQGKLLGLGFGLPGIVDTESQVVRNSRRFQLQDYPLGERLRAHFDVPVTVDHNVHLAAHAERHLGQAKGLPDFLFFMVNRSLDRDGRAYFSFGTALHLSDEVYRGAHFAAGELDPTLAPKIDLSAREAEKVLAALEREDGPPDELMTEIAVILASSLAPVANLIDPSAIVIGSEQPIRRRSFLKEIEKALHARLIPVRNRKVTILTSKVAAEPVAAGAALRALEAGLYGHEVGQLAKDRESAPALEAADGSEN
jgi:predicted NBD/HSP70 family sugar kinase